jgi:hypothetical protein
MAATLGVATIVDMVACPDGCTDDAQHESTTASVCGLCHGWSGSDPAIVTAPASRPVPSPATTDCHEQCPDLAPIEHPPRIA